MSDFQDGVNIMNSAEESTLELGNENIEINKFSYLFSPDEQERLDGGILAEDVRLDDIQAIYSYYSSPSVSLPEKNILDDIMNVAGERVQQLKSILEEIIENGEPEPPEVFATTLLRLSLIRSRPKL